MKELKEVPGLDPKDVVKIKKFSYGDRADLGELCLNTSNLTLPQQNPTFIGKDKDKNMLEIAKQMGMQFNFKNNRLYTLVFGIAEAPFFKDGLSVEDKLKIVRDLEFETGNFLFEEISKINNMGDLTEVKKK